MRNHSRALSLSCFAALLGSELTAQATPLYPLENLHANDTLGVIDYQHVRGVNYVASLTELYDGTGPLAILANIPTASAVHFQPNSSVLFTGISSCTAMWFFYDWPINAARTAADQIDDQLHWIKKTGFNSVRVFLSFPLWQYYRRSVSFNAAPTPRTGLSNPSISRFQDFVARCWNYGLHVMPVLWDDIGGPPVYADANDPKFNGNLAQGNFAGWVENPGETKIPSLLVNNQLGAEATAYVHEHMDAFVNHPQALLAWDAMNEPFPQSLKSRDLVLATFQAIQSHNGPVAKTKLFSFGVSDRYPYLESMANDPLCDIIGLHPYGQTALTYSAYVFDALHDRTLPGAGPNRLKPLICTEAGSPGLALSYQDTVSYCTAVERPDVALLTGKSLDETVGIGFMPWAFMTATNHPLDLMPFKDASGMFYGQRDPTTGNCIVRERSVVQAHVGLALAHNNGVAPWVWTPTEIANLVEDVTVPSVIVPTTVDRNLDEYGSQVSTLTQLVNPAVYSTLTWDDCTRYSRFMLEISVAPRIDLARNASTLNNNVFTNPPNTFPYVLPAATVTTLGIMLGASPLYSADPSVPNSTQLAPGGSPNWVAWSTALAASVIPGFQVGDPYDVTTTATVEGQAYRLSLGQWAALLLPILVQRGGP